MTPEFISNIPNALELKEEERNMIVEVLGKVEAFQGKRVASADEVENFLGLGGEGGAWGMTVCKVDVKGVELMADLWLLDTCKKKEEGRNVAVREVRKYDGDGSRGLQLIESVSLPGGFQDRVLKSWYTWDVRVEADGSRTYIIAFCPLEKYSGEHLSVPAAEKMKAGTSRGVYIIREVTENTCEWTKVQQSDLKISGLPGNMVDFVVKQHLFGDAKELQEKVRCGRSEFIFICASN